MEVTVSAETPVEEEWLSTLEAAVRRVLSSELGPAAERCWVGVTLVDAEAIRALNARWRREDHPTDVLSFPTDPPPTTPKGPPVALGDIVIAPECVTSLERGGLWAGVVLCAVHGALHLLGYDHASAEDERSMFALQERYAWEALNR